MAFDGCSCSEVSGPATTPCAPISASQVRPSSSAFALLITTTAAAPSEIWEAEPAVMVPSLAKAGRSRARVSTVVSGRIPSSSEKTIGIALSLRNLDRHDLFREDAVLLRHGCLLMRTRRKRVLLFTRQRVALVVALGGGTHRQAIEGVGESVERHRVDDLAVAVLDAFA